MDMLGVWAKPDGPFARIISSSVQNRAVGSMVARVHLMHLFFNRVVDIDQLITALFSPALFDLCEVHAIRNRIGHLRTFSILQCHQDAKVEKPREESGKK